MDENSSYYKVSAHLIKIGMDKLVKQLQKELVVKSTRIGKIFYP